MTERTSMNTRNISASEDIVREVYTEQYTVHVQVLFASGKKYTASRRCISGR